MRAVLVLRYFSELNSKEIGSILELPDATVRGHLRQARRKLFRFSGERPELLEPSEFLRQLAANTPEKVD